MNMCRRNRALLGSNPLTGRRTLFVVGCTLLAACIIVCRHPAAQTQALGAQAREQAYRLNNVGVARLQQYDYRSAGETFRRALESDPGLGVTRVNLAIALYYDNQLDAAEREGRAAADALPGAAQPQYVLGLIARGAGRAADAAERFRRVLAIDPDDVGAKIQLGQVLVSDRQFAGAIAFLEEATKAEPFNATAAYGLATALIRAGRGAEGRAAMARFQQLRDNPAAITYSTDYLGQGQYAEAMVSTGLEPELTDRSVPDVEFVNATDTMLNAADASSNGALSTTLDGVVPGVARGVSLADIDGDGDLDLLFVSDRTVVVRRNERGRFGAPIAFSTEGTTPVGVVAGDYDNDGRPDLFVPGVPASRLFHQESDGTFRDVTERALPGSAGSPARTAAFVDVDHDGDLDIVVGGLDGRIRLLRNDGNGRFTDATSESRLAGAEAHAVGLVPTDFDNDRDIDLLAVAYERAPLLFSNLRDGTFRDVAADVGMPPAARYTAVAAADVNKDGATDFFLGRTGAAGLLVMSHRPARFITVAAPDGTGDATAAQFVDYDNDGLLDLLVLTPPGPRLFRNVGDGWVDVSMRAMKDQPTPGDPPVALAVGDLDRDGDADVLVRLASGRLRAWRNDGGSRHPSLRVNLVSRVSNRSGLGANVELAAGSLRQRIETSSATPAIAPADVVFGLGFRERADVVRVLWPAGILQAEVDLPGPASGSAAAASLSITELNRKPSSCPFLFTWSGSRFEFVTDFMGGGEMGAWIGPGEHSIPDPEEYVRIPRGGLMSRDGRLELRVTNELEEALFVDRLRLVAVAHPSGVEVYPRTGLRSPAERRPFELYTVRAPHPPLRATDDRGRDVLDRVSALDRRSVDTFALEPIQGYAQEHALTVDLGAVVPGAPVRLLLTGWTDYAFSSDNVAAHQAGLVFAPPSLQMRDERGQWETVVPEIGLPTGRPQTIVVDLTDLLRRRPARRPISNPEVRIVTTARVYWDQILVDTSRPAPFETTELGPSEAMLRWRGFSAEVAPEGAALPTYDYARVSTIAPWKTLPGRYTRLGDVRALLTSADDQFVVSAPGDEIALAFDVSALPPLRAGWERTFLLHADGFSKEMNLHSASPDRLEPLPFHAMSRYPYMPPEHYPRTREHDRYRSEFNTRLVRGPVPMLEQALLHAPYARSKR